MTRALLIAARVLEYPGRELFAATDELRHAAGQLSSLAGGLELCGFLDRRAGQREIEAQEEYVETFDFHRRACLHLSYYRDGDRRQRGATLLGLKRLYREAGFELAQGELPDYLPVVLEFAALAPTQSVPVLGRMRPGIELLRSCLHDLLSPYAKVLDAVAVTLPALGPREAAEAARIARHGPPEEEVGLEPFAPPEVMPILEGMR